MLVRLKNKVLSGGTLKHFCSLVVCQQNYVHLVVPDLDDFAQILSCHMKQIDFVKPTKKFSNLY